MTDDIVGWPSFEDDPAGYWREWTTWARRVAVGLGVDVGLEPPELFEAVRARAEELADAAEDEPAEFASLLAVSGTAERLLEQYRAEFGPAA